MKTTGHRAVQHLGAFKVPVVFILSYIRYLLKVRPIVLMKLCAPANFLQDPWRRIEGRAPLCGAALSAGQGWNI